MRAAKTRLSRVAAEGYHLASFDTLTDPQRGSFQQVAVERGVTQLWMVDHQVVWQRAKIHIVHVKNDAVSDSHDFGAARGTEIYTEVNALTGTVSRVTLKVSPDGVAVRLGHQPGIRPWRFLKGQNEWLFSF